MVRLSTIHYIGHRIDVMSDGWVIIDGSVICPSIACAKRQIRDMEELLQDL